MIAMAEWISQSMLPSTVTRVPSMLNVLHPNFQFSMWVVFVTISIFESRFPPLLSRLVLNRVVFRSTLVQPLGLAPLELSQSSQFRKLFICKSNESIILLLL